MIDLYDENEYANPAYDKTAMPSTAAIRATYATDYYMTDVRGGVTAEERAAAFDRWLAAHDAALTAKNDAERDAEKARAETAEAVTALADAARAVGDYDALDRAIGAVLFNVSNFPERAQSRLLGQNMRPLTEKLVDAVLAVGFVRAIAGRPTDPSTDHENGSGGDER